MRYPGDHRGGAPVNMDLAPNCIEELSCERIEPNCPSAPPLLFPAAALSALLPTTSHDPIESAVFSLAHTPQSHASSVAPASLSSSLATVAPALHLSNTSLHGFDLRFSKPMFGCYWRNRNNNILGFPHVQSNPGLEYSTLMESEVMKGSHGFHATSGKGDAVHMTMVLPADCGNAQLIFGCCICRLKTLRIPLLHDLLGKQFTRPEIIVLFNQFCAETKAMNEKKAKSKESPVKGEHIEKDGGGGRGVATAASVAATSRDPTCSPDLVVFSTKVPKDISCKNKRSAGHHQMDIAIKPELTWKYSGPAGRQRAKEDYTFTPMQKMPDANLMKSAIALLVIGFVAKEEGASNTSRRVPSNAASSSSSLSRNSTSSDASEFYTCVSCLLSQGFFIGSTRHLRQDRNRARGDKDKRESSASARDRKSKRQRVTLPYDRHVDELISGSSSNPSSASSRASPASGLDAAEESRVDTSMEENIAERHVARREVERLGDVTRGANLIAVAETEEVIRSELNKDDEGVDDKELEEEEEDEKEEEEEEEEEEEVEKEEDKKEEEEEEVDKPLRKEERQIRSAPQHIARPEQEAYRSQVIEEVSTHTREPHRLCSSADSSTTAETMTATPLAGTNFFPPWFLVSTSFAMLSSWVLQFLILREWGVFGGAVAYKQPWHAKENWKNRLPHQVRYGTFVLGWLNDTVLIALIFTLHATRCENCYTSMGMARQFCKLLPSAIESVTLYRVFSIANLMVGVIGTMNDEFYLDRFCFPHPCYAANVTTNGATNTTCEPCKGFYCPQNYGNLANGQHVSLCKAFPSNEHPILCGYRYCHVLDDCLSGGGGDESFIGFAMDSEDSYGHCLSHHKLGVYVYGYGRIFVAGYHLFVFGVALRKAQQSMQNEEKRTNMLLSDMFWRRNGEESTETAYESPSILGSVLGSSATLYIALIGAIWSWITYGSIIWTESNHTAAESKSF